MSAASRENIRQRPLAENGYARPAATYLSASMSLSTAAVAITGGLTSAEVRSRLSEGGPNAVPDQPPRRLRQFLRKFASPVPVMLEVTVALEVFLGHHMQALLVAGLLVFNAIISFVQELSADRALDELRAHLAVTSRVCRDGTWRMVPARELVPEDLIYLRAGDIVPSDARVQTGTVEVDQSALTGESAAVEVAHGGTALSGSIVRRGEASAVVTATGIHSASGRTAELVQKAQPRSHLEETVLGVVKYLVLGDALLAVAVVIHAVLVHGPLEEAIPFALMLLIASVPVALPATFSLATAVGTRALTRAGVLVTRLASVQELAAMDLLCSDKTGTLTENQLTLKSVVPFAPFGERDLLQFAALASDEATQDPIDLSILSVARERKALDGVPARTAFVPFDPATKRSEARFSRDDQRSVAMKGAPRIIGELLGAPVPEEQLTALAEAGCRVVAVAAGPEDKPTLVGLLGLRDPPRADSHTVVEQLRALGVRILMVTGDDVVTGRAIAREIGLGDHAGSHEMIGSVPPATLRECDLFAGVYPADKLRLVEQLQAGGSVVGMTGDGVNDAPALKRAEVGLAMSNATDVAKAAASLVLTRPGLSAIGGAIVIGREIHQRMLTYVLNKLVKTFHLSLLLSIGVIGMHVFVTRPRHLLLLLFLNDFITMSLSSDRVRASPHPDRWNLAGLALGSTGLALGWTAFSFVAWWAAGPLFHLDLAQRQTFIFVLLVFTCQATIYLLRTREPLWGERPGFWLAVSTVADVIVTFVLAGCGLLVRAVPVTALIALLGAVVGFVAVLDAIKVALWRLVERQAPKTVRYGVPAA